MKVVDIIFSLICGRVIGLLAHDFLLEWGVEVGLFYQLVIWLAFPFFSLLCLWLAFLIGRKLLFVFQGAKFLLVGAFATVIDLKIFEYILWVFSFFLWRNIIIAKAVSFLISTSIKYWGNKYWAFGIHEPFDFAQGKQEDWKKEAVQFFVVTLGGLVIDLGVFYILINMVGPQPTLSPAIWLKLSVILAALAAAIFNFLGYKFLVFKK